MQGPLEAAEIGRGPARRASTRASRRVKIIERQDRDGGAGGADDTNSIMISATSIMTSTMTGINGPSLPELFILTKKVSNLRPVRNL